MDNKTIELHTIATFQGKEYELENLLNGLLNKLEEKDKEIERLKNGYCELEKYFAKPNKFIERPERMKILDKLKALKEGDDNE